MVQHPIIPHILLFMHISQQIYMDRLHEKGLNSN